MLAARIRSGLVETLHDGAVAVFDGSQTLVASAGEIDQPFYLRSSAKPFQAFIAQASGARLSRTELALAASSHDGFPVHVAIVRSMLQAAGLDESDLQCPADWPLGRAASTDLISEGHVRPRSIWHNCSGKHAAWLRACVASGWPTAYYLKADHPLQVAIQDLVTEVGEYPVDPVGVDGCGAPVLRTTVRAMGLMYSRLGSDGRFGEVFDAMHSYPALVSGTGNRDALIAASTNGVAKSGAAGCLGVTIRGQWGLGVKAWDGNDQVAAMAAADALLDLNAIPDWSRSAMRVVSSPDVTGGGEVVGRLESNLELIWS